MIKQFSILFSERLISAQVIKPEDKNVYAYGFELVIASVISMFMIIIISLVTKNYFMWIPYLIAYIPLRTHAGGYHAKTHFVCISTHILVYLFFSLSVNYLCTIKLLPIISSLISFILILLFSPIETPNNPMTPNRRLMCRKISIIICAVNLAVSIVIFFSFNTYMHFIIFYFSGIIATTLLFVMAVIKSTFGKETIK